MTEIEEPKDEWVHNEDKGDLISKLRAEGEQLSHKYNQILGEKVALLNENKRLASSNSKCQSTIAELVSKQEYYKGQMDALNSIIETLADKLGEDRD